MISNLFQHPIFKEAIADIEALGVRVTTYPSANAVPYAVIGGRSNARWWFLPLQNRYVTSNGLALFQPILKSAKCMKQCAVALSQIGLGRLWAKPMIYLTGEPSITQYFGGRRLSYAYFTGTDSPHRKVAIQIMDEAGKIKGFAKLTRNPRVRALLMHETATLEYVNNLGLQTVYVPKVLFAGDLGNSSLIVTDTLKTPRTPTTTQFTAAHRAFIKELSEKTAAAHPVRAGDIAKDFRRRFDRIRPHLEKNWLLRLDTGISTLEEQTMLKLNACLSHGDFTPWNTFMSNGRLYVFDWEYAEQVRPSSNDIIQFVLNEPRMRSQPANVKIDAVLACLSEPWVGIPKEAITIQVLIYLLTQTLRQIERLSDTSRHNSTWDGANDTAAMFDRLFTCATSRP